MSANEIIGVRDMERVNELPRDRLRVWRGRLRAGVSNRVRAVLGALEIDRVLSEPTASPAVAVAFSLARRFTFAVLLSTRPSSLVTYVTTSTR